MLNYEHGAKKLMYENGIEDLFLQVSWRSLDEVIEQGDEDGHV
jgi:hypothetical protein